VLLLGDDPLARGGLAALLEREPSLVLAGESGPDGVVQALQAARPEVVCWDPGGDGEPAGRLVAASAPAPVLALLGAGASAAVLLRGGVRGLVARQERPASLAAALSAVAHGHAVLPATLATGWLRTPAPPGPDGPDALTAREREVLALLAEGLGNKAIAARLDISDHTAKFHVNAILSKLGAGSRAEAIVLAARRGLILL